MTLIILLKSLLTNIYNLFISVLNEVFFKTQSVLIGIYRWWLENQSPSSLESAGA